MIGPTSILEPLENWLSLCQSPLCPALAVHCHHLTTACLPRLRGQETDPSLAARAHALLTTRVAEPVATHNAQGVVSEPEAPPARGVGPQPSPSGP